MMARAAFDLPVFPWDTLAEVTALAEAYPGGAVNLTIGSPVDGVSGSVQAALAEAADAPGYPPAVGSVGLRAAIAGFMRSQRGMAALSEDDVLLTIGSKELVASLAFQLGLRAGDTVGFPEVSYPTYEVGAILAGAAALRLPEDPGRWPGWRPRLETGDAEPVGGTADCRADGDASEAAVRLAPHEMAPHEPDVADATDAATATVPHLVWLNSPGNPNGHVYDVAALRRAVAWARANGAILVSDECYALLDWEDAPRGSASGTPSLLDEAVTCGNHEGLLVVHSLSKQCNLAGYRAAWICGDSELVAGLREVRKHWGLMVPEPVQAAMEVALEDREILRVQKERYRARRERLLAAARAAGLATDPRSVAGLYLWLHKPGLDGRELAVWFARRGIRVAPGEFYGPAGAGFVRVSLTATDADIDRAAERLAISTRGHLSQ